MNKIQPNEIGGGTEQSLWRGGGTEQSLKRNIHRLMGIFLAAFLVIAVISTFGMTKVAASGGGGSPFGGGGGSPFGGGGGSPFGVGISPFGGGGSPFSGGGGSPFGGGSEEM